MKEKDEKEKLDFKNLNALIQTARVILKLGLILAICALVIFGFVILEKTQLLDIIGTILNIISPLFIGLVIAWIFEPLIKSLEKRKVARIWSTVIIYVSFALCIILLVVLVVPEFISQLKELIAQVPSFLTEAKTFIANLFSKFNGSEVDITTIQNNITTQFENLLNNFTSSSLSTIIPGITNLISNGARFILGVLVGFYMSLDFEKVGIFINSYIPLRFKKEVTMLSSDMGSMTRSYINGTLFTSLIVIVLTFIGLVISGMSSPLLFAIFCGITNIIPYFGPYIGGIPTIIVAFSISPMCGIIALITIVIVQFIEGNIINPLIVGKAVDIHPITVMLSLLVFQHYFGILGMILATPIVAAIKILFNFFNNKYHFVSRIKQNI